MKKIPKVELSIKSDKLTEAELKAKERAWKLLKMRQMTQCQALGKHIVRLPVLTYKNGKRNIGAVGDHMLLYCVSDNNEYPVSAAKTRHRIEFGKFMNVKLYEGTIDKEEFRFSYLEHETKEERLEKVSDFIVGDLF